MSKNTSTNGTVLMVCFIAALAGLLFGLDVAFVNGSLDYIARDFSLTKEQSQQVAGWLLAGAAIGALFSGKLSSVFGRKKVLLLSAFIFTFFTLIGVFANSIQVLLWARLIIGIAVGIASFVAPLYLSEIAPYKMRGGLIAMYQFMITVGIFLMFVSNAALMYTESWRIMMSVLIIPSSIMLIGTFTLPESPRWLALKGKLTEAESILGKIRNTQEEVNFELEEIKATIAHTKHGLSLLRQPFFIKVIFLGIALQMLQQFCGMNAFMYYSGKIFATAGISNPSVATIVVGLVNVLTTILAIKYVDKFGRKPILYFGLILLVVSCTAVSYLFNSDHSTQIAHYALVGFSLLFIFAFAISLGPIIWILCAEIYPLAGRDFGVTVTTMTNWICNTIIGSFTLTWFTNYGESKTFLGFGIVCFIGIFLVKFFTPETKDVPLEEIEANLKAGGPLKLIGYRTKQL